MHNIRRRQNHLPLVEYVCEPFLVTALSIGREERWLGRGASQPSDMRSREWVVWLLRSIALSTHLRSNQNEVAQYAPEMLGLTMIDSLAALRLGLLDPAMPAYPALNLRSILRYPALSAHRRNVERKCSHVADVQ